MQITLPATINQKGWDIMSEMPELPVEAKLPRPIVDIEQDAMMKASAAWARAAAEKQDLQNQLDNLQDQLGKAVIGLEMLQLTLAEERNRHASLQNAYNEIVEERATFEAILAVERDHHEDRASRLGHFEFPRVKRKRNGKRNGDAMPNVLGSEGAVAGPPPVLAHGPKVLDESAKGQ
jgi:hypothetical protein